MYADTQTFFAKVYAWMFGGLLLSGATAYYVALTPAIYKIILLNNWVFYGLLIGELILVIILARALHRLPPAVALLGFALYCFMNGLTLSVIFLVYTATSISLTFFITAGMFGIMSIYGFVTKADLSKLGHILLMALFGVIIATLVNLFVGSSTFDFILSIIGVIIFTGLTAYDTQRIKSLALSGNTNLAILGALNLYLDFINLFLNVLRLFGRRR